MSMPASPSNEPFVVGIVGDSGSGKTTVAESVARLLGPDRVSELRLDDYHRYTREERAERGVTSLDPSVHNFGLMEEHLKLLRSGRPIRNRSYDHADGTFGPVEVIEPGEVVIVRGLLGYPTDELRALYHLAVFLQPEPELLFRWKLRRDTFSRGYKQADVLKYIAHHLLDAKQFLLPQSERADLVVRHDLPDPDAPDSEVRTTLVFRRRTAEIVTSRGLLDGLPGVEVRSDDSAETAAATIPVELSTEDVDRWAGERLPDTYDPAETGCYHDDSGETRRRPQLALVESVIALIALAEAES
jgi:uridine kinase